MTTEDKIVIETLTEVPLLSSLSHSVRKSLCTKFTHKKFQTGENIIVQGDVGTQFFIVESGKCSVLITNSNGTENEISTLIAGDYFGEQALLDDACRGTTVRAVEETECLILEQNSFNLILTEQNTKIFKSRNLRKAVINPENFASFKNPENDSGIIRNREKDSSTIEWLLQSVKTNILFSHLSSSQRLTVVKEMYKKEVLNDEFLIKQGDEGNTFYVVSSGSFKVYVNNNEVATINKNGCFGELALLYNAPRSASVKCIESGTVVWCVDRYAFRKALIQIHTKSTNENIAFLKKCKLFKCLLSSELSLIDQALETKNYIKNDIILQQGDEGDRFYIIKSGEVEGEVSCSENDQEYGLKFTLKDGAFFGERALIKNEPRAATIKVTSDTLECLTLSREDFNLLLGPLEVIMKRTIEAYQSPKNNKTEILDFNQLPKVIDDIAKNCEEESDEIKSDELQSEEIKTICKLNEFRTIGTLGRGAFGVATLVVDPHTSKSYALKAIRKSQIVRLGQQKHILNEKAVMNMLNTKRQSSKFIVNLCSTYRDTSRIYFLLEPCLGGELFTLLRDKRTFDEITCKFYTGCVILAFEYIHSYNIIYRDLKPTNLMLSNNGYLKIIDFGFAKIVPNNTKTFTLCGTPEYLAPEIITGSGHNKGADWWSLGVLIYEMLVSFTPFYDEEQMKIYRKIIKAKFRFPKYISSESRDLISKLLKPKSTKRLGVIRGGSKLIKNHDWFKNFNWKSLKKQTLKPPFKTKVKSQDDLSNFDKYDDEEEEEDDDDDDFSNSDKANDGWDDEF